MAQTQTSTSGKIPVPPKAEKIKKELTLHQKTRIDNYFWLNQRENPKVIDYLKAENNYLKAAMKHTEPLQQKLYDEFILRLKQEDQTVPYHENGYYYYSRYEKGKEYPIYCRRKGTMEGAEEIIFDVNKMAEGHAYFHLSADFTVSPDSKIVAYGVDTVSRRKYTIHFKNLETGQILPEEIPNTNGRHKWANDSQTLFYVTKDHTLREYKVSKHRVGTPVSEDKEIYHEADDTFSSRLLKTSSDAYILILCYNTVSSEYRYLNADQPDGEFKIIQPRQRNLEYYVNHHKDKWVILTNWDAQNFRIMETPITKSLKENWKDVIPHRDDVLLSDFNIFKNHLVVKERKEGLEHIHVMNLDNKKAHYIAFDQPTYSVWIESNQQYDSPVLRYTYSSLAVPETTYDYDMDSKKQTLLKQEQVGGGFNPDNYETQWLWATARDGAKVPISLFYRKGLQKNGKNPLFLYGYGSYGYSMSADFGIREISLVDRGFVYAIAHIRGGSEMGRHWYKEGKLLNKKNTFTDFIDCADFLIAEKYTNANKLFAGGGSAGGLLMGAIVNMRPELFKGIIAAVPFVDVVTTMLDTSIPLTTSEFDEWGNPAKKEFFDYMLSYSPYDNVEAKDYPAMLVTTGLHDSQVQYWEPAKWVAKLRDMKTDKNPLLLHINMDAGHGGASGRFKKYKISALEYAFVLDLLGIKE